MKRNFLFLFLLTNFTTFAQSDTTYFVSIRKVTLLPKEAKYYTLEPVRGICKITLFDIKNNQKYGTFNLVKLPLNEFFVVDDEAVFYYPDGKIKEKGIFKKDKKFGDWHEFYESGNPKETISFDEKNTPFDFYEKNLFVYKVLEYWDNLGVKSVDKGNGLYFFRDSLTTFTVEVKKGLPDGNCRGTYKNYSYTELYKKGEIKSGEILVEGEKITYDKINENAIFIGGISELYGFIATNLKYPLSARKANREGKVFVKFVVEKDNALSNITVLKGIGQDCDNEALRVIRLMNGYWQAGKIRGINVRFFYTMPVSFVLE